MYQRSLIVLLKIRNYKPTKQPTNWQWKICKRKWIFYIKSLTIILRTNLPLSRVGIGRDELSRPQQLRLFHRRPLMLVRRLSAGATAAVRGQTQTHTSYEENSSFDLHKGDGTLENKIWNGFASTKKGHVWGADFFFFCFCLLAVHIVVFFTVCMRLTVLILDKLIEKYKTKFLKYLSSLLEQSEIIFNQSKVVI